MSRGLVSALFPLTFILCFGGQAAGQSKALDADQVNTGDAVVRQAGTDKPSVLSADTTGSAKSIEVLKAEFKSRQAERRRSLLNDDSDLGLGMTIRKYRHDTPASDLADRREALGLAPNNWGSRSLFQNPHIFGQGFGFGSGNGFGFSNNRFGSKSSVGRASIYDWRAPIVGNSNGKSFIVPGGFALPGH